MKCKCGEEMFPLTELGVKYLCPKCGRVAVSYTEALLLPLLYIVLFGLVWIIALGHALGWDNDSKAAQEG